MNLKTKIFIRIISLFTLLIVLLSAIAIHSYKVDHREIEKDLIIDKIVFISNHLEKLVLWDDRVTLKEELHKILVSKAYLTYSFILKDGNPYVYTFDHGIPKNLISLSKLQSKPRIIAYKTNENMIFYDVSRQIGDTTFIIHIGMKESLIDEHTISHTLDIIGVAFIIYVIGFLLTFWITRQITREVDKTEKEKEVIRSQLYQSAKLASIGTLASGVAHELNNPLTIVIGYAQSLNFDYQNIGSNKVEKFENDRTKVNKILHAANRMKEIVKHLRMYTRQEAPGDLQVININTVIKDSLVLLNRQLRDHNIKIQLHLTDDLPFIWGSANQLESVFQNLVINSRDAFDDIIDYRSKMITISTLPDDQGKVCIIYEDNATGMSDTIQKRLFDPFFTTKEQGKGTGLGMSISLGIIEDHQGDILVESTLLKGSVFTIKFPSTSKKPSTSRSSTVFKIIPTVNTASIETMEESNLVKHDNNNSEQKPRVLIIDDDKGIVEILDEMLSDYFETKTTTNSKLAIDIIKNQSYDIIITDIRMPEVSGEEILSVVKQHRPNIPVVLISGFSENDPQVKKLISNGAAEYISKPFSDIEKIRNLLKNTLISRS